MSQPNPIVSKPTKKRKKTTTIKTQPKATRPKKKVNAVVQGTMFPHISDDENMFFSHVLAKKDSAKNIIHKSIEKATEVMKDAKLEIQKCPFCKKHSATYNMVQRRSGDEGSTAEFKCTNELCARSWRGRS